MKRNIAEKTGPERVYASGAGRHAFKESSLSLIWPIMGNKQIATAGWWNALLGGEQKLKRCKSLLQADQLY